MITNFGSIKKWYLYLKHTSTHGKPSLNMQKKTGQIVFCIFREIFQNLPKTVVGNS